MGAAVSRTAGVVATVISASSDRSSQHRFTVFRQEFGGWLSIVPTAQCYGVGVDRSVLQTADRRDESRTSELDITFLATMIPPHGME